MSNDPQSDHHQLVLSLMPMMLNGTLSNADRAMVRDHLDQCPQCREETELTGRIMHALDDAPEAKHVADARTEAALARIGARIDAEPARFGDRLATVCQYWLSLPRVGMVMAGLGLLLLAVQFMTVNVNDEPAYDVLSADPVSGLTFELTVERSVPLLRVQEHFAGYGVTVDAIAAGTVRVFAAGDQSVDRAAAILRHARLVPGVIDATLINTEVPPEVEE